MPFSNSAGQGATISLSEHVWYDPVDNKVKSDVPIVTTLSSLFLGRHISLSSGGSAMYFRDHTNGVDVLPCYSGIHDQRLPANQGSQGAFGPTGRVYGPSLLSIEAYGSVNSDTERNVSVVVDSLMTSSTSIQGFELVLGEDVAPEDTLVSTIYSGNHQDAVDPIPVFQQKLSGVSLSKGDLYMWWYDTPADFRLGDKIHQVVEIIPNGSKGSERMLLEREAGDSGLPWRRDFFRDFTDELLVRTSDVLALEAYVLSLHSDTTDISTKLNGLLLLRNGDTLTWPGIDP